MCQKEPSLLACFDHTRCASRRNPLSTQINSSNTRRDSPTAEKPLSSTPITAAAVEMVSVVAAAAVEMVSVVAAPAVEMVSVVAAPVVEGTSAVGMKFIRKCIPTRLAVNRATYA